jgi:hypothetical protein
MVFPRLHEYSNFTFYTENAGEEYVYALQFVSV